MFLLVLADPASLERAFYQNSPTPFPRPDVVGGDKMWLWFYLC